MDAVLLWTGGKCHGSGIFEIKMNRAERFAQGTALFYWLTAGERQPFQTYLPQGQGTVSVGFFFSMGFRQTGQFFCHIVFT